MSAGPIPAYDVKVIKPFTSIKAWFLIDIPRILSEIGHSICDILFQCLLRHQQPLLLGLFGDCKSAAFALQQMVKGRKSQIFVFFLESRRTVAGLQIILFTGAGNWASRFGVQEVFVLDQYELVAKLNPSSIYLENTVVVNCQDWPCPHLKKKNYPLQYLRSALLVVRM